MPNDISIEAYEKSTRLDIHEVVRRLNSHLGPTLVATLSGAKDPKASHRWAKAGGGEPRTPAEQRLRTAHRVWLMISGAENDHIARAWFIGANPRLGEEAPVMVLREGRITDVVEAANAFVEGTDD
jgi:hypothetical protein